MAGIRKNLVFVQLFLCLKLKIVEVFSYTSTFFLEPKKMQLSTELRAICEKRIRLLNGAIIPRLIALIDKTLLFESSYVFDSYML